MSVIYTDEDNDWSIFKKNNRYYILNQRGEEIDNCSNYIEAVSLIDIYKNSVK